jgi:hypothetical protein
MSGRPCTRPHLAERLARLLRAVADGRPLLGCRQQEAWRSGYAVRRDWPDGAHEFVAFRASSRAAARFIGGDREFWRRGPVRPLFWSTVVISRRDFDLHAHRRECRAPDCPTANTSVSHSEGVAR